MANFPLACSNQRYQDTLPRQNPVPSLLSSSPCSVSAQLFQPSDLESLASLAASATTWNPHDQNQIDLEAVRTNVETAMQALQEAKARPRKSKKPYVTAASMALQEIVNKGMEILGEAVSQFRGKCEWVSAQPLPNIETRLVSIEQPPKPKTRGRKARAALAPAATPCKCILAASKRMKTREFHQALQSGAIMCTCKSKRA